MRLALPLLVLFSVLLAGCAERVRQDTDSAGSELQSLFNQPYIDPLTRYLQKHEKDPARADDVTRVRDERDRRCSRVADRYAKKSPSQANLDKLKQGYTYSCKPVVDAFAVRVAGESRSGSAEIKSQPGSGRIEAESQGIETARSRVDAKAVENCYLLFGIKNYHEAQTACELPAREGDARAQYNLAVISEARNDTASALSWTRLAAAQGLPEAQFQLGRMYQNARGLDRDEQKALEWFRQAGEQGLAAAQYHTGLNYYRGKGTGRNYDQALQWFTRAAKQGYAPAQAQLGEMYAMGTGVDKNGMLAENWLKRAANQGIADAQYRLGMLYAEGKIVDRDEMQAYIWLSVATLAGQRQAQAPHDKLAQKLDSVRIEQAQQRIRDIVEQRH